jgi:hypothetical protein
MAVRRRAQRRGAASRRAAELQAPHQLAGEANPADDRCVEQLSHCAVRVHETADALVTWLVQVGGSCSASELTPDRCDRLRLVVELRHESGERRLDRRGEAHNDSVARDV